jgi:hypothetical protein
MFKLKQGNIHEARQLRWSKQLVLVENYSHICVTRIDNNFTLLILNQRMQLLLFWRFKKAFQSICHCNVVESKSLYCCHQSNSLITKDFPIPIIIIFLISSYRKWKLWKCMSSLWKFKVFILFFIATCKVVDNG